jgi:hypothetical protein
MSTEPAGALLVPGEEVERYEVLRTLGAGGMAQVVLVRHTALGTLHALKVLTLAGPGLADRLLAEGRVQAQLRHPNVVAVSDVITVKGMPALVLEYVDGPDLERWIAEAPPDPVEAERLFRGIVAGVAAAHAAGHIHRDLKPANVLLATGEGGERVPRIADFGLVKALAIQADTAGRTRAGLPLGTPQYMAPEQIRSAADVDRRADIWSLGCILYELVTHTQAFPGEDLVDVWERASQRRRGPVPEGTPAHLVTTIDRCLQPDPDRRPADCEAVLALLDDRRLPIGAIDLRVERMGPPSGRGAPRALLAVAAALGSVVVVLGVTGVVLAAAVAGRAWPDGCPTDAGVIGYARAPWVFDKEPGSVWRVAERTPVGPIPSDPTAESRPRCTLGPGARVEVVDLPIERGGERWVPVHGDRVVAGSPEDPPVAGEAEGLVGGRCVGVPGERIGWVFTRMSGLSPPRAGGTWDLDHARAVVAGVPEPGHAPGAAVCALRGGTTLEVKEAPVKAAWREWWVPVTAGGIIEPGAVSPSPPGRGPG